MGLQLIGHKKGNVINITKGTVVKREAEKGEWYSVVDSETGKTPDDVRVARYGDDLIVRSGKEDAQVLLEDFWGVCSHDDQCYVTFDVPATANVAEGQVIITQTDNYLTALNAGEIGSLTPSPVAAVATGGAWDSLVSGLSGFSGWMTPAALVPAGLGVGALGLLAGGGFGSGAGSPEALPMNNLVVSDLVANAENAATKAEALLAEVEKKGVITQEDHDKLVEARNGVVEAEKMAEAAVKALPEEAPEHADFVQRLEEVNPIVVPAVTAPNIAESATPNTSALDASAPSIATPDVSAPNTAESVTPNTSEPDASISDASASSTATPNTSTPNAGHADLSGEKPSSNGAGAAHGDRSSEITDNINSNNEQKANQVDDKFDQKIMQLLKEAQAAEKAAKEKAAEIGTESVADTKLSELRALNVKVTVAKEKVAEEIQNIPAAATEATKDYQAKLEKIKTVQEPVVVDKVNEDKAQSPNQVDDRLDDKIAQLLTVGAQAKKRALDKAAEIQKDGVVTAEELQALQALNKKVALVQSKLVDEINKIPGSVDAHSKYSKKAEPIKPVAEPEVTDAKGWNTQTSNGVKDTLDDKIIGLINTAKEKVAVAEAKKTVIQADGMVTKEELKEMQSLNKEIIKARTEAQKAVLEIGDKQEAATAKKAYVAEVQKLRSIEVEATDARGDGTKQSNGIIDSKDDEIAALITKTKAANEAAKQKATDIQADGAVTTEEKAELDKLNKAFSDLQTKTQALIDAQTSKEAAEAKKSYHDKVDNLQAAEASVNDTRGAKGSKRSNGVPDTKDDEIAKLLKDAADASKKAHAASSDAVKDKNVTETEINQVKELNKEVEAAKAAAKAAIDGLTSHEAAAAKAAYLAEVEKVTTANMPSVGGSNANATIKSYDDKDVIKLEVPAGSSKTYALKVNDPDDGENSALDKLQAVTSSHSKNNYFDYSIDSNNQITLKLNKENADVVKKLATAGQKVEDTITVTSIDGATKEVTVYANGTSAKVNDVNFNDNHASVKGSSTNDDSAAFRTDDKGLRVDFTVGGVASAWQEFAIVKVIDVVTGSVVEMQRVDIVANQTSYQTFLTSLTEQTYSEKAYRVEVGFAGSESYANQVKQNASNIQNVELTGSKSREFVLDTTGPLVNVSSATKAYQGDFRVDITAKENAQGENINFGYAWVNKGAAAPSAPTSDSSKSMELKNVAVDEFKSKDLYLFDAAGNATKVNSIVLTRLSTSLTDKVGPAQDDQHALGWKSAQIETSTNPYGIATEGSDIIYVSGKQTSAGYIDREHHPRYDGSTIKTLGGDDIIIAKGIGKTVTIDTGEGNDVLQLSDAIVGWGKGYAGWPDMDGSSRIFMGNGDDKFIMGENGYAWGWRPNDSFYSTTSVVDMGAGNDFVRIGKGIRYAFDVAHKEMTYFNLGDGDDTLEVWRGNGISMQSDDLAGVAAMVINLGSGNDTFSTTGRVLGSVGITGTGNNKITIGDQYYSKGAIVLGGGDDTVIFQGSVEGTGVMAALVHRMKEAMSVTKHDFVPGLKDTLIANLTTSDRPIIDLGDGNNGLAVVQRWNNMDLKTGSGNDDIVFGGNIQHASIKTGAGSDTVTFNASLLGNTKVELGAGDDKVVMSKVLGSGYYDSYLGSSNVFDGGEGFDSLKLVAQPGAKLQLFGSGYTHAATVKNIEDIQLAGTGAQVYLQKIANNPGSGMVYIHADAANQGHKVQIDHSQEWHKSGEVQSYTTDSGMTFTGQAYYYGTHDSFKVVVDQNIHTVLY